MRSFSFWIKVEFDLLYLDFLLLGSSVFNWKLCIYRLSDVFNSILYVLFPLCD